MANRCFGGTCFLLQDQSIRQARNQSESRRKAEPAACSTCPDVENPLIIKSCEAIETST
jgi:hypothetical protein